MSDQTYAFLVLVVAPAAVCAVALLWSGVRR